MTINTINTPPPESEALTVKMLPETVEIWPSEKNSFVCGGWQPIYKGIRDHLEVIIIASRMIIFNGSTINDEKFQTEGSSYLLTPWTAYSELITIIFSSVH